VEEDTVGYPLFYEPASSSDAAFRRVVIDPDESIETVGLPKYMFGSEGVDVPCTTRGIIQIDHWANLITSRKSITRPAEA
jgi:hypothetical protein